MGARQGVQIGFFTVVLSGIIAAMIWNTSELNITLQDRTGQYVKDVSYQLANDITARIHWNELSLEQLADSVPRLQDKNVEEEFLNRKSDILNFDTLFLIDRDGSTVPENVDVNSLGELSGVRTSFEEGKTALIYAEGQNLLLFSTPVYRDGKVEKVLAGIRKEETMQALIQPKSFEGNGLSCIVDSEGKVIISPTDVKPFLQLEDIFASGSDTDTTNAITKMQEDMKNKISGAFTFTAVDGRRLIMSYHALEVNDWILLTLVPADLISGGASVYVFQSFVIVAATIVLSVLFILMTIRFYRKSRRELEKSAFTDPLTGGMNNAAFQRECQRLTEGAPLSSYTVVLLNVKGFKLINENFGIAAGNDTLRHIYNVLKMHLREDEVAARGEADYFFLALRENNQINIQLRLDKMIQDINSFTKYADIHYYLTIQQAACMVDELGLNVRIVQDRARTALRMRKEGGGCAFYSSDLTKRMKKEQELNVLFESAIRNHEFQVYLQPKVSLRDGAIGGAEALVRWNHPELGMISPADFIPVFEKNENICVLDLYIFEEVCRLLKRWRDTGCGMLPVSVNLSRAHFKNFNFLRAYADVKEKYGIPDGWLELEVTESVFFDEQQREVLRNSVDQMHAFGLLCSLDDFGVGYSSLGLLKETDVDTIKLDRQFFVDIENPKAQNVIESFIQLAEKLKIHIVAEGIETEKQLDFLRRVRCEMVQGYVFSKPLAPEEFDEWRRKHTEKREL